MIVARPRLRTSRERIEEHLAAGRQQSAVWLYLMWKYGGQWRRWRHPETLKERMADTAQLGSAYGKGSTCAGRSRTGVRCGERIATWWT